MAYDGNTVDDLDPTKPDGTVEPPSVIDDAIREVKRALIDLKNNITITCENIAAFTCENNAAVEQFFLDPPSNFTAQIINADALGGGSFPGGDYDLYLTAVDIFGGETLPVVVRGIHPPSPSPGGYALKISFDPSTPPTNKYRLYIALAGMDNFVGYYEIDYPPDEPPNTYYILDPPPLSGTPPQEPTAYRFKIGDNGMEIIGHVQQVLGLSRSTYFGYNAGVNEVIFGYEKGNVGIGYEALRHNTEGYFNTAVGESALLSNTIGYWNTAVGESALLSNTTGSSNTAIGGGSLRSNTIGYSNTAIGADALPSNTEGYFNTAVGDSALYSNTTGYSNTAIGESALYFNTTGYFNTAIGESALYYNTTGHTNTAVGAYALHSNTEGYSNIAIGVSAGVDISDGLSPNQTSSYSIYIGHNTKAYADGDTNEIVIGANATGLGSNTVVLGNDSIVKTALKGNVGIGLTDITYQLQLSQDSAAKPGSAYWTVTSDERLKENIELADLNRCYEVVKSLPLKRFKWRDDVYNHEQVKDRHKLGWISQDVEKIFPKAVDVHEFVSKVEVEEIDENGNPVMEEVVVEPERRDEKGNVIPAKKEKRVKKKPAVVIEDCKSVNVDQIYAALFGAVQLLIQKVERLEEKMASIN